MERRINAGNRRYMQVVDMDWFIPIGAAIAFGLGALGAGIAMARIGSAGAGTVAERPETFGYMLIFLAIPETIAILGFVIAAMILVMI